MCMNDTGTVTRRCTPYRSENALESMLDTSSYSLLLTQKNNSITILRIPSTSEFYERAYKRSCLDLKTSFVNVEPPLVGGDSFLFLKVFIQSRIRNLQYYPSKGGEEYCCG